MLDLLELLDKNAEDLARTLAELPDAMALIRRFRAILADEAESSPWFPVVPMERFLRGMAAIEEYMLARMGWEVEPDPVERARARSRLRRGLRRLTRQYAAAMDRENATVRARLEAARQRLEAQQAFNEALLRLVHAAVVVLDGVGRVLAWNPATASLTGISSHAAVGRGLGELLPDLTKQTRRLFDAPDPGKLEDLVTQGRFDCPGPDGARVSVPFRLARLDRQAGAGQAAWVLSMLPGRGSASLRV